MNTQQRFQPLTAYRKEHPAHGICNARPDQKTLYPGNVPLHDTLDTVMPYTKCLTRPSHLYSRKIHRTVPPSRHNDHFCIETLPLDIVSSADIVLEPHLNHPNNLDHRYIPPELVYNGRICNEIHSSCKVIFGTKKIFISQYSTYEQLLNFRPHSSSSEPSAQSRMPLHLSDLCTQAPYLQRK